MVVQVVQQNSDFLYKVCFAHLADGGIRCGLAHSPEQQRVLRDFVKSSVQGRDVFEGEHYEIFVVQK